MLGEHLRGQRDQKDNGGDAMQHSQEDQLSSIAFGIGRLKKLRQELDLFRHRCQSIIAERPEEEERQWRRANLRPTALGALTRGSSMTRKVAKY